jgi:predicted DNA-binding ArsR family transcriptional regulator
MASYLDPKPSDIEITEAVRYHYLLNVQRAMQNIEIKTIREALDLLKRIELMETWELYNNGQSQSTTYGRNYCRVESASNIGGRNQEHAEIRQIQTQPQNNKPATV